MAEPLLNEHPTTVTNTTITSHHRELRDLLVCPTSRGKVYYVRNTSLYAQDILSHSSPSSSNVFDIDVPGTGPGEPEQLCDLRFHPVCLSYGAGLLAAGGLHSELALRPLRSSRWTYTTSLSKSINNSLYVTSASLPSDPSNPARTRLFVSNNDHTLSCYEAWIDEDRDGAGGEGDGGCRMELSGSVRLSTALNHCSLSPDGRTLLVVGDTPEVSVLNVSGGMGTTMKLTTTLEAADASFSTAWSADGRKFAVSSQNGEVRVWDVRSTKPLAKFVASRAGASTRAVKFTPEGAPQELMAFAEGSSNFHVVDASTFTTHQTLTVPPIESPSCPSLSRSKRFLGSPPPLNTNTRSRSSSSPTPGAGASTLALDRTLPIRRSFTPAHLLLSSFHLVSPSQRPSSPPRPFSRTDALQAQVHAGLYADLTLGEYKPPVPWYASGYGSNTDPEITGLTWDPTGRWLYVGTEGSVVEWSVAKEKGWCDEVQFT